MSGYRKDEYNWRYDNEEPSEDVIRASAALENLQLDRKARNLTTSWRYVSKSLLTFLFTVYIGLQTPNSNNKYQCW